MRHEVFIALDDAARAYCQDLDISDVEKAINEEYASSLIHKEFENEDLMRGFQDGLEFCSEESGCGNFWVITPDTEEERERLMSLAL